MNKAHAARLAELPKKKKTRAKKMDRPVAYRTRAKVDLRKMRIDKVVQKAKDEEIRKTKARARPRPAPPAPPARPNFLDNFRMPPMSAFGEPVLLL